jgi:hypothetical protein
LKYCLNANATLAGELIFACGNNTQPSFRNLTWSGDSESFCLSALYKSVLSELCIFSLSCASLIKLYP